MLAWTIYCAIVPLKTDYKLLYTFGNNCGTEKIQCLLSSDIWVPYFAIVWFQKLKHLYPSTEDSLICTLLPLAGFSVPGGFWWPPSPQEFPEFLNGDFTYLPWVPEVFLLCGGNFRCRPKADTSSARVSLILEIQSRFGTWKQRKWILTQLQKYGRILLQQCSVNIILLSLLFSQTFSFFTITFANYVCVVFM